MCNHVNFWIGKKYNFVFFKLISNLILFCYWEVVWSELISWFVAKLKDEAGWNAEFDCGFNE